MPKVNRNDPCPCGSGKKYKSCCMRADQIADSRELSLLPEEGYALNGLLRFFQSPRFERDILEGARVYWGGAYDPDAFGEIGMEDMRRSFEWLMHDYRAGTEQQHIIELYLGTLPEDYPVPARAALEAWSRSTMGLFRIVALRANGHLDLHDCLREIEVDVADTHLARSGHVGELIVGRLFVLGEVSRLSYMSILLPGELEPDMVTFVRNAYEVHRAEHPQATWDEFLRAYGHLFNAYLLSARAEPWRHLIGPGTRYHDPARARSKLSSFTDKRLAERAEQQATEQRPVLAEKRTASGIVVPGMPEERAATHGPSEAAQSRILIPGRDF